MRIYYTFKQAVATTAPTVVYTVPNGMKAAVDVWHISWPNSGPVAVLAEWVGVDGAVMWADRATISANDFANLEGELILMPGDKLRITLGSTPTNPVMVTGTYALDVSQGVNNG